MARREEKVQFAFCVITSALSTVIYIKQKIGIFFPSLMNLLIKRTSTKQSRIYLLQRQFTMSQLTKLSIILFIIYLKNTIMC